MKIGIACLWVLAVLHVAGCSSQQAYSVGQGWQRNQCERLPDRADVQRCSERGAPSYDAYKREVEPRSRQWRRDLEQRSLEHPPIGTINRGTS